MTVESALPAEFTSFVGRSEEVAGLLAVLRNARALTLCGAGGIGKTRIALRLLAAAAADFPDGTWFVDLGELRQPQLVVATVAAAVGVDEEPGRPLTDTLADAIAHRQAILALDNCEHLVSACATLCRQLLASSPGLKVLATSREPLRVAAETVWQVPPMTLPPAGTSTPQELHGYDAVRLFAERATAGNARFRIEPGNAATVSAICRALDGLPLAIELAAAWVRVLTVEQIAARLGDKFKLLTSPDRSATPRHQTLRATIDWSYDLLSDLEQVLLRRLSVFAEWSLEMAEEVCADDLLPAAQILDIVTTLADKSLLEVDAEEFGQVRYRMLETIREYAAAWLSEAGEADLFLRRRREYTVRESEKAVTLGMALLPAPWSVKFDVFRRVDVEAANLREVLSECLRIDEAETGLRICTAIRTVWIVRGTFAEGIEWIDAFLGLDSASAASDAVIGPALVGRAQLALAIGSGQAEELAQAGLERCWAAGEQFHAAAALNLLTEIALHAGKPDEATARAEETLQVARSAGDRWNEGYALGTMATLAGQRGNMRAAQELAESALSVMRGIEQHWGAARTLMGLGDLARLRADHASARQYYQEALVTLREINARPDIARCLAGLGRIALDQSDLPAARRDLAESLRLSYASGARIGLARCLEAMAKLVVLEGRPDVAVQLAGAVTTLRAEASFPPMPGSRTQRFLDAAQGLGQHAVARLWAEGAAMTSAAAVQLALGEPRSQATPATPAERPGADPLGLTVREREVVALIAAGKSNRAIGAELYISPATAARHVANILAKLGYTSRSQVAVWAKSAGLTSPRETGTA